MKRFLLLVSLLVISFSFGVYISKQHYQPQIDRLTRQLKKINEETADKTLRIAELTGNGG